MEAVTITLDGVEVSGSPGMRILDLARESGVDIPTLCDDPCLSPAGACRICLVEEEKTGALLASCVTPIRAGMVINTRSPRVLQRRKTLLELMLASHPDTCMVCDKGNRCQLRQVAAGMGIGWIGLQRVPQPDVIEEVNPFIERDHSKCIMCARCIRADQELVVEGAIDYIGRGFSSRPATLGDLPLEKSECTFCGTCVAMCPTGALREKGMSYRGATAASVETVCPFCGCGCALSLETKDGRAVSVKPSRQGRVNHGALCVRGSYGHDFIHSPDRLLSPLVKRDGAMQPAYWEEALEFAAAGLNRIREKHGPDSLAVLGSPRCTNEENYLIQRLARSLGTNNVDNGSRLYSAAGRVGMGWSTGFPGATNSLDEMERSDVIMVIGANPAVSAPVVGYAIKRAVRKGAALLLIDARPNRLDAFARLKLTPLHGTDLALVNGMARVIIEEKLFDEEFVTRRTDDFADFERTVESYRPERVAALTGVPANNVVIAARMFAGAGRGSIVYGNGLTQQAGGTDGVRSLANLALLMGNTNYHRGGVFGLQRDCNAQGACDMGSLPDFLPGYQSVGDARARKKFEERWKITLPATPGLTALDMVEQAGAGKLKGMLIIGENPIASFPRSSHVRRALGSLEFLVVADMFLTETAKLATVVLPAASFAEKEGTFTNFEGRVQPLRKAIKPLGESLPDWEIISRLAAKIGLPMPYRSLQQVADEIEEMVPMYQRQPAGMENEDPDWDDTEAARAETRRLYGGSFPGGFGRFFAAEFTSKNMDSDLYPFSLVAGSVLYHSGSGTRSLRASRLKQFVGRGWVEVSGADAGRLGLKDGDTVRVVSAAGEITAAVKTVAALPPGQLFAPISFPDCPVNELFDSVSDPQSGTPAMKACAVRLERTGNNA